MLPVAPPESAVSPRDRLLGRIGALRERRCTTGVPENKLAVRGPAGLAVWRFFAVPSSLSWLAGQGSGAPGASRKPDPPYPTKKWFFMIAKTFTRKNGGKVFVIMGICGLAGTAALRVGLSVRKRSGSGSSGCR